MDQIETKMDIITEKSVVTIPFIVHENAQARAERREKRHFITTLILIFLLVLTNCLWLNYEMSFEDVVTTTTTQEVTQDAEIGNNNFIGGDYGKADSKDVNNNN